jgi:hypothetical protein
MMATALEERIPPLAAGDKLTREEFLRRWEAHPQIKNAELLGGIVFMSARVSVEHGDMDGWLGTYKVATPGAASGHNTTSFLLEDVPQPDWNLRILPEYGGASWVEDRYLHGIPELLAEIARSTASYDLHVKLELYQAAKVPEYLVILLFERERFAGTFWSTADTNSCRRTRTASGGRACSPDFGWTARRSWPATCSKSWPAFRTACVRPNTHSSLPSWPRARPSATSADSAVNL